MKKVFMLSLVASLMLVGCGSSSKSGDQNGGGSSQQQDQNQGNQGDNQGGNGSGDNQGNQGGGDNNQGDNQGAKSVVVNSAKDIYGYKVGAVMKNKQLGSKTKAVVTFNCDGTADSTLNVSISGHSETQNDHYDTVKLKEGFGKYQIVFSNNEGYGCLVLGTEKKVILGKTTFCSSTKDPIEILEKVKDCR